MQEYSGKKVINNNHFDYLDIQRGWNRLYRTRPQEILLPKNISEVCDAIKYVKKHNLPFRVRSQGHRVDGISSINDGIVIDLRQLDSIIINDDNTITIGPAISMGTLYKILGNHGLVIPGGSCLDPSVVGVALGGGLGDLTRTYGWLAQNILSCKLIDATGEILTVNNGSYPELFWAIRGAGGSNFGIVVSLTLQAYPLGHVFSGSYSWDWSTFIDFFDIFQHWFPHLDSKINVTAVYKPQNSTVGINIASLLDSVDEITAACKPLLSALPTPVNKVGLSRKSYYDHVFNTQSTSLVCNPQIRSTELHPHFTQQLDHSTIQKIKSWLENFLDKDSTAGEVTMVTGAHYSAVNVAKADKDPVSIPHMNALFTLDVQAHWLKSEYDTYYLEMMKELVPIITNDTLHLSGVYLNAHDIHLDDRVRLRYGKNFDRLVQIKQLYDPENFFHFPSSIPILNYEKATPLI